MYLRRVVFPDGYHYVIRESYSEGDFWKSRDLADLGTNPAEYIEYVGGNGFYFNTGLEEKLQAQGVEYSTEDLECLFLPFLNPRIRRVIESFQTHTMEQPCRKAGAEEEMMQTQQRLHSFDKRRLHFLRCGRVDIGNLDHRPWKFLTVLVKKSRDEIEHIFEGMERILRPHEMRSYLFTALNLQTRFPHHVLRNHPSALDQEMVDNHLVDALCSVNDDETFFAGTKWYGNSSLHPYLTRYIILYFDSGFEGNRWPEFMREFMHRQQPHQRMPAVQRMDIDRACEILAISSRNLARMSRRELVRLYRRKAKELHPDRGGDKECFIRMAAAFARLIESK